MNTDERINNLVRIAELQQQSLDKLTDDVADLVKLARKHEQELKVVQISIARLAEGYHTH